MSHESLPQFLAKIDLFEGLSKDTLSDLIERGTTLKVPAGSRVIEQGAHDAGLQVVLEGSAAVEVNGVVREPLGVGDYFGEISLIDGGPRTATVIAETPMTVLTLERPAFRRVLESEPDVAVKILASIATMLRRLQRSTTG